MGIRLRGIGAVVVGMAMLCTGIGAAGSAAAAPWGTHCTGAKAKEDADKPFIVQACQRAYSAAAIARVAADAAAAGGNDDADTANAVSAAAATAAAEAPRNAEKANKAAEAQEKAVAAVKAAFGRPDLVKIPPIAS